ncbi:MAG: hypothetical protein HUJ51_05545 [Eggerthellaceae bacterium]|nr:hypothetical protein [Eggerthellaceae bacterium]
MAVCVLLKSAEGSLCLPVLCVVLFYCAFWKVNISTDYNTYDWHKSSLIKEIEDFCISIIKEFRKKPRKNILKAPVCATSCLPVNKELYGEHMINSLYKYHVVHRMPL